MKRNQIDDIYFGGSQWEAAVIMANLHAQGISVVLISSDDLMIRKYWITAGAAGGRLLMTSAPNSVHSRHGMPMAKAMGKDCFKPKTLALQTYAAIQIRAQAAPNVRSLELELVAEALDAGIFRTFMGKIIFYSRGYINQKAYIQYEWQKGK